MCPVRLSSNCGNPAKCPAFSFYVLSTYRGSDYNFVVFLRTFAHFNGGRTFFTRQDEQMTMFGKRKFICPQIMFTDQIHSLRLKSSTSVDRKYYALRKCFNVKLSPCFVGKFICDVLGVVSDICFKTEQAQDIIC